MWPAGSLEAEALCEEIRAAKQILTGENYSRYFYRAQQTFEAFVLIAALSYTDNSLKR